MRNSLKVFILALKFPFKEKSFGHPEKVLIVLLKFSVIWVSNFFTDNISSAHFTKAYLIIINVAQHFGDAAMSHTITLEYSGVLEMDLESCFVRETGEFK